MTVSARNWAWDQQDRYDFTRDQWVSLTSPEKFVLLCLAEHESYAEGYAFPSIARIATRCRLSPRTVSNALAALEASRLIRREKWERSANGQWARNCYFLNLRPEQREMDDKWVELREKE